MANMTKDEKTKIAKAHKALWLIVASDRHGMCSSIRKFFWPDQWCALVEAVEILNDKYPEIKNG